MNRACTAVFLGAAAMGCAADPGGDAPAATFTEIYDRYFPSTTAARCSFCHSMPASDISNGNLSTGMDQAAAHAALVGATSTSSRCAGQPLVVPFEPDQSLFLDKFAATPSCGDRMPLGGMALSAEEVSLVRGWIEAGAEND